LRGGDKRVNSFVEFPLGTENIVQGFGNMGYTSIGVGAVEWFRHPDLTRFFHKFIYTWINIKAQIGAINEAMSTIRGPLFMFMNIGETHDPYEFVDSGKSSARIASACRHLDVIEYSRNDHVKQMDSCSYIDRQLINLFCEIKRRGRPTVVVVCGDHGECFGEDGLVGHGFYHQKIMEVPLGIGELI
jgi:hypothetical protein